MIQDILFALWFLLPAAAANVAPILSAAIPYLKKWQTPLDGGRAFRGRELLGPHKTWRGLISGFIAAFFVVVIQQVMAQSLDLAPILANDAAYLGLPSLVLAALFILGALGGDAFESFLKRQSGIKSGSSWFPFDQIDYVIGTVVVMLPFATLSLAQYIWIFILWSGIHLLASYVGWLVGLKKEPI